MYSRLLLAFCFYNLANRLMATFNTTAKSSTVTLLSPWYPRSRDWYGSCFHFRFMMYGSGVRELSLYQKLGNYSQKEIWKVDGLRGELWHFGYVSVSTIKTYQVGKPIRLLSVLYYYKLLLL